jgi:D-glycero-alpha-D-manno-heptose-7-phosphate kinase
VNAAVVDGMARRSSELRAMRDMVDAGANILTGDGDLDPFGELLAEAWRLKRGLSPAVTCPATDSLYERGLSAGALGGKLLGAGRTGFMLFFVPPERQPAFSEALSGQVQVRFGIEPEGARILHGAQV